VQSLVGSNPRQVDPAFQVLFFYFLSEVLLYVSPGTSKFEFGPKIPQEILEKEQFFDELEWNEGFLYVSYVLIIDLVSLLLSLSLFQHLIYSENYTNNDFFSKLLFIK